MSIFGKSGNVTPKVLSFVFAILLWFHITTNQTFSSKYTIPIRCVGPSEGFMIASECPKEAVVIISGMGKDLAAFRIVRFFNSEPFYALANLTGLPEGENSVEIGKNMVHLGLFSDLKVDNILSPDNGIFKLDVDRKTKRTVAVSTDSLPGYLLPGGFCVVGTPVARPEFVVLEGPSRVLNTLESIPIDKFASKSVTEKSPALTGHVAIPPFSSAEPENVEIAFTIEALMTRKITGVAVSLEGFPVRNRPKVKPDSVDVTVRGAESLVRALFAGQIDAAINYRAYLDTIEQGDSLMVPDFVLPDNRKELEIVGVTPDFVRLVP